MTKTLGRYAFNIGKGSTRYEDLEGRPHLVVPAAILAEAVLNGSEGALFYPGPEIEKTVQLWNGKPVVVSHPDIIANGVCACDPKVFNEQKIGVLFNSTWDGKLRPEVWIDVERANAIEPSIIENIEAGIMVECSTGLTCNVEKTPGEHGGQSFDGIARDHQPDHLAILVNEVGAFSIADGGGILQLNHSTVTSAEKAHVDLNRSIWRRLHDLPKSIANAMSDRQRRDSIESAIRSKMGTKKSIWIEEVFPKTVVFEVVENASPGDVFPSGPPMMMSVSYEIDGKTKSASLTDDPVEVRGERIYRKVADGSVVANEATSIPMNAQKEDKSMSKEKKIQALIANDRTHFTKDHSEFLNGLEEDQLDLLIPVEVKNEGKEGAAPMPAVDQGVQNATQSEPVTLEGLIANASTEDQEIFNEMKLARQQQRSSLIQKITANPLNTFTEEDLQKRGLADLRAIANLCQVPQVPTDGSGGMIGAVGGVTPVTPQNADHEQEPLGQPTFTAPK